MRKKLISTTLLISIVISLATISMAQSSGTNMIYVDPSVFMDPGFSEFTVDICLDYVAKADLMLMYQFHLQVDPAVLRVTDVENGPFLTSKGATEVNFYPGAGFDETTGWLALVVGALAPSTPWARLPWGGGVLATVTFERVGEGSSPITLGPDCGLIDVFGQFISKGNVADGYDQYISIDPELYVRTKGAHGTSGVWPEWVSGAPGDAQTLYCRVLNYGSEACDVYVEFSVKGPGGIDVLTSNTDTVAATVTAGNPSEVTVYTASFNAGPVGHYRVSACLYFKAGAMADFVAYSLVEGFYGGVGLSRDIPPCFKTD